MIKCLSALGSSYMLLNVWDLPSASRRGKSPAVASSAAVGIALSTAADATDDRFPFAFVAAGGTSHPQSFSGGVGGDAGDVVVSGGAGKAFSPLLASGGSGG